ncbi:hypothetical protein [Oceanithermus profundus]
MTQKLKYALLGFLVAALGLWGLAVTIPNTFSSGEVVSAAKMNENFQALKDAVDALEAKLAEQQAMWAALPTRQGFPRAYVAVDFDGAVLESFNTTGGAVGVTRVGPGRYDVDFGDVAVVYKLNPLAITALTDGRRCYANSLGGVLKVLCRDPAGNLADSQFWVILFNVAP